MILAQMYPTNQLDAEFLAKLLICLLILGGGVLLALGVWAHFRRKPSIDVELAKITESLTGVHKHLASIDGRLREGDEVMSGLRERQAVNAETIKNIGHNMHEVHSLVNTIIVKMQKRGRSSSQNAD